MKKILILLFVACMITVSFGGCDHTPKVPDDGTTEITPTPSSDFEYEVTEDGSITITKYVGTETLVVIPEIIDDRNVTKIGSMCFSWNSNIRSVTIPDSVIEIGGGAFCRCSKLETVRLSSQLEIIGGGAFEASAISNISFPESLKSIKMRAFADCVNLKYVVISKNLNCGEEAFCGSGLETIIIEEGVETIASSVFASTQIREITLPKSLKTIGMNAFGLCEKLESVVLNEGLTAIDTYAFSKSKLTEIVIPKSVSNLKDDAFLYCPNLQKVKFEGDAPNAYISGMVTFPTYIVCYHENAKGFTSPQWCGYPTEIW